MCSTEYNEAEPMPHLSRCVGSICTIYLIVPVLLSACIQLPNAPPATSSSLDNKVSTTFVAAPDDGHTAISRGSLRHLAVPSQYVSRVLLDDAYIYWLTDQDRATLYRYPLSGGQVEQVVSSEYQDGDIGTNQPIRSGDWLIYVDTRQKSYKSWKVQAFNVKTKVKKTLDSEDDERFLPPVVTAHGDWVIVSRLRWPNPACTISALEAHNLVDGRTLILDEVCAEGNYYWHYGDVFGQTVVAERNLSDAKGGGTEVIQFNLSTGMSKTLSTNTTTSSGPVISARYIVWRAVPRFSPGQRVSVYDRQTGEQRTLSLPGQFANIRISDHWLYWEPYGSGEPFRVFDLQSSRVITVTFPQSDQAIRFPDMHQNTVAWARIEINSKPEKRGSVIEWTTLK